MIAIQSICSSAQSSSPLLTYTPTSSQCDDNEEIVTGCHTKYILDGGGLDASLLVLFGLVWAYAQK